MRAGPRDSFPVAEQRLDPGLIGRRVRSAELLGNRHCGEALSGAVGTHLRAVVADREQQRHLPGGEQVGQRVGPAAGQRGAQRFGREGVAELEQPFGAQRGGEDDLDLGGAPLAAHQACRSTYERPVNGARKLTP